MLLISPSFCNFKNYIEFHFLVYEAMDVLNGSRESHFLAALLIFLLSAVNLCLPLSLIQNRWLFMFATVPVITAMS